MSLSPAGADEWARRRISGQTPKRISRGQRVLGFALRSVFILAVLIVTIHVSMPQSASIWTAYETPGDFIRLALGAIVCLWVAVQLFSIPDDAGAYRTWLYLGLAAVPFVVICIVGIW